MRGEVPKAGKQSREAEVRREAEVQHFEEEVRREAEVRVPLEPRC